MPTRINTVVKLELETSSVKNLIDNHSGELGRANLATIDGKDPTCWRVVTSGSPILEGGFAFVIDTFLGQGFYHKPIRVTPGEYLGVNVTTAVPVAGPSLQLNIHYHNSNENYVGGASYTAAAPAVGTPVVVSQQFLVPANAATATLVIAKSAAGSTPLALHLSRFMVVTGATALAATQAFVAPTWTNLTGESTSISLDLGNDSDGLSDSITAGVLSAVVQDATYDPSTNSNVKQGARLRVRALSGGVYKHLFLGRVENLDVEYGDNAKPVITITATNTGKAVVNTGVPVLGATASAWGTEFGTGMSRLALAGAYMLKANETTDMTSFGQYVGGWTSRDDSATIGSWLRRWCLDRGYWSWVDQYGDVWVLPTADLPAWNNITLSDDPTDATAVKYQLGMKVGWATHALVNDLTVTRFSVDEDDGISKAYGPYQESVSAKAYGVQSGAVEILNGTPSTTAASILAGTAFPKRYPQEIVFSGLKFMNQAVDLHVYDKVKVRRSTLIASLFYRVLRVRHDIVSSGDRESWTVTVNLRDAETTSSVTVNNPTLGADTGPGDIITPTPGPLGSRRRNSTFGVAHNTWTTVPLAQAITLDQVTWDSTNNRFTVPKDGRYVLSAGFRFAVNATGTRGVRIVVSGSSIGIFASGVGANGDGGGTLTKVHKLEEGDTVQMQVYQSSGGSLNIDGANDATFLDVTWLGP